MALSAARSDLTISIVGEDETQRMLEEAKGRVSALEARMRSLKSAGDAQAASARGSVGALDAVNGKMKGLAGLAEGAVDGVDKMKSAFDKVLGVAGFVAPAIAGIAAGVVALAEELFGANDELARLEGEMAQGKADAEAFAGSMRELTSAINSAVQSSVALTGQTATLRARLATLTGDLFTAEFERRNAETLAALKEIEAIDASIAESRSAQTKAREAEAAAERELADARATAAELEVQIAREQMDLKLGIGTVDRETLQTKQIYLMRLRDEIRDNDAILANAQAKSKALENQVGLLSEQKGLLRDIANAIQQQVFEAPGAAAPGRRRGGGGRSRADREREAAEALIESIKAEMASLYDLGAAAVDTEMEFERDIAAVEKAREERRKKALDDARKAAEEAAKLQQEMAEKARLDLTEPVFAFSEALRGSLIPELDALGGVMDRVMAQFELFRGGQVSLTQAIAAGATEIAASAARSIGGVKAEAAVRAAYEFGMGFATLGNPVISAGHFTAAALLGGVATGIISTGGGTGSSGASGGMGKPAGASMSSGASTGPSGGSGSVTNVYNLSAGVVDGQSTTRAFRRAEIQSRNTGFAHAGGW